MFSTQLISRKHNCSVYVEIIWHQSAYELFLSLCDNTIERRKETCPLSPTCYVKTLNKKQTSRENASLQDLMARREAHTIPENVDRKSWYSNKHSLAFANEQNSRPILIFLTIEPPLGIAARPRLKSYSMLLSTRFYGLLLLSRK